MNSMRPSDIRVIFDVVNTAKLSDAVRAWLLVSRDHQTGKTAKTFGHIVIPRRPRLHLANRSAASSPHGKNQTDSRR